MQTAQQLGPDELYQRISQRVREDLPQAVFHARAVVGAASPGAFEKVQDQLSDDHRPLFESGSEGKTGQP